MTTHAIGAADAAQQGQLQQASVGQDDLFKIMLTQLSYQDPLEPMDNQEFVAQLAQFNSLEQTRQQNEKIDSLLSLQSANQATGLLGKTVEVTTDTGSVVGEVTTITFEQGSPSLTVRKTNGEFLSEIRLSQVFIVR